MLVHGPDPGEAARPADVRMARSAWAGGRAGGREGSLAARAARGGARAGPPLGPRGGVERRLHAPARGRRPIHAPCPPRPASASARRAAKLLLPKRLGDVVWRRFGDRVRRAAARQQAQQRGQEGEEEAQAASSREHLQKRAKRLAAELPAIKQRAAKVGGAGC